MAWRPCGPFRSLFESRHMIDTSPYTVLFVPGNKPERFIKAAASGADAIVIDLEDAVAPEDRSQARASVRSALNGWAGPDCDVFIRINAMGTDDHNADLALLDWLPTGIGFMLAKADQPLEVVKLRNRFPERPGIGLIETPQGIENAPILAQLFDRLAFGSIDYANSIGAPHKDRPLLAARSALVLASALAGRPGPIDGVTTAIGDSDLITAEARASSELGFRGKLLIHPKQVGPALSGLGPEQSEVEEARRILFAVSGGAAGFEGKMVDAPVLEAARRTITQFEDIQLRIDALGCG